MANKCLGDKMMQRHLNSRIDFGLQLESKVITCGHWLRLGSPEVMPCCSLILVNPHEGDYGSEGVS